ncbi:hypothetical protein J5N97_012764 [Dioscorea zingiberensis]|uniref:Uncharacterized protein n=1 Tax=Dioscorea zingiberensis TaxID=325984 RepID=A0A9D5CS48_9LILI|nr:hypothetical protein J5N97_012764 [Dioscorea zingiberensis]
MAVAGRSHDQQTCFSSAEDVQHTVLCGSESRNPVFLDSRLDARNVQSGSKNFGGLRPNGSVPHHATPLNHQGTNYRKSKSSADVNLIMPFNSKPHLSSPSYFPSQPIKPEHKTGQSSSEVYHIAEGHSQLGRISLFTNQGQGMFSVGNNLGKVRPTSQVVNLIKPVLRCVGEIIPTESMMKPLESKFVVPV